MPSRQDQLHSYQFSVQRVVSALVMRETDPAQSPFRRVAGAALAGALFAAIGMAGALVYGVYAGSAVDWKKDGQVIIEKETGTRYVLYDGKLHPAANYASAMLVAGLKVTPRVENVSRSSLKDAPRGAPIGIAGAPDSMPTAGQVLRNAWTLCSVRSADSTGRPTSTLLVGSGVPGGTPMRPKAADRPGAMLASTPDGKRFLIFDNHRYPVADPVVVGALGWKTKSVVPVAPAAVNALAAGPELRRVAIPGAGKASPALPNAKVGQVYNFVTADGAGQFAVALADGLADIKPAVADLIAGDPDISAATSIQGVTELGSALRSSAKQSSATFGASLPFEVTPRNLIERADTVCLSIPDSRGVTAVTVDATVPGAGDVKTPSSTRAGGVLADRVVVPPGTGALVQSMASKGASGGALSIVTELGVRFPVPSRDIANRLGFATVKATPMPAEVVALLPAGPALDPTAAVTLVRQ